MEYNFLLFWIGAGIVFLILELITAAFYGFALAVAAFMVAIYVFFANPTAFDGIQGLIFVIFAIIFSYFFPKWLTPKGSDHEHKQGLDMYIGETRRVRSVGEDFKVKLDGVDYITVSDDDLEDKMLVEIIDRKGSVFIVEKVTN